MAADQHVLAGQAVGLGERDDVAEQIAKGFADIILRIIRRAERGEQVVDHVTNRVANEDFTRAAGATKRNAQLRQMPLRVVLAEDFHLRAGVAGLLAEKGSAGVGLAVVTQLRCGDRCPAGLFHRLQGKFFRVGIPRDTGNDTLRIRAANQRGD